jgi:gamma-glutamylcyclotransferase (GGCT)/AIG2-like uncharacterized protein YtfP
MLMIVYGTLRRGEINELISANYIGDPIKIRGFAMYDLGWFPGAVRSSWEDFIIAELIELPDEDLELIDELEGVDEGLYHRELVALPDGEDAWIYLYDGDLHKDMPKIREWSTLPEDTVLVDVNPDVEPEHADWLHICRRDKVKES